MFTYKQWQKLPLRESIYLKQPKKSIYGDGRLTPHGKAQVEELHKQGKTWVEICELTGATSDVVVNFIKHHGKLHQTSMQTSI